jgi:alkaline phosphatase D
MTSGIDRRSFLKQAGATALTLAGPQLGHSEATEPNTFHSAWPHDAQRPWPGPEYWTNPLQDWRIANGRLECFSPGGDRNVVLLTREISGRTGRLAISVRLGQLEGASPSRDLERGFVGFRVGVRSQMSPDYRAAALYGRGMNAGINADGRLFLGALDDSQPKIDLRKEVHLELRAQPSPAGYAVTLRATTPDGHAAEVKREVPSDWLTGGLALVCSSREPASETAASANHDFNFYPPDQQSGGTMRFWFADWTVFGSKVDVHKDRAFGPVLFCLYTVSRGVLKLSAQFPPLGNAPREATLQVQQPNGSWESMSMTEIDPDAWNATFRVADWDASQSRRYRVLYAEYSYSGVIRPDPVAKEKVVIGLLTCIWDYGFPHVEFTTHLAHHQPELLFWTGDQIYESVGGFGSVQTREPAQLETAMLDFLRKWYVFGWAVGNLTREIPSVCMTDDHDMFHGNIWGCGGRPTNPALGETGYPGQDSGGYKMPPRWVNMVQRAQTAHLPDPFEPVPVLQGITVYYTSLQWGGISFAILEDRKWKSAPQQQLPGAQIVNGFAQNPSWNAATQSDVPGAELLGQRQLDFLESWAADWSGGTWMKFAVSQTIFGCLHTEPASSNNDSDDPGLAIPAVGAYVQGDHLVADHDSAAWPQHGRNAAILKLRKGFAAHLSGDQHLGTTVLYGVEEFRDGVYSICTPAISNIWPRRWFPPQAPNTGDHLDAFGNHMSVLAIANPAQHPGPGLDGLRHRVTGYTILTCDRKTRKTTVAEWPRWVDPSTAGAQPYAGWPITFDQIDNGLSSAEWTLPGIGTPGFQDPVVQVQEEGTEDVVYTLRISGDSFTPRVRKPGAYTVVAFDPDGDYYKEWRGLQARRV